MLVAGSFACASLCFIHSQLHVCSTFAIWQHPDPAQNLTKSCRPSQLSTHKISSKSVHNFFRYPAKIQKSGVSCFLDPDYDPDPAQNLINSSRPSQLLTRIILWKFVHNLLRYTTKIPKSSVNPFPGSRVWSGLGSKVQFVHVPTSVDTQNFIQIHPRVFE